MSDQPPVVDVWRGRVLDFVDDQRAAIVEDLAELVRIPTVSGSDEEGAIQHQLATRLADLGLEVDAWEIPLDETLAQPDFPGVEVDRQEGWGVVGRLPGRGDGPTLMLNAHVDVVPPGDLDAWRGHDPFAGTVTADAVHGRGACDMKAGLVASLWAVRALAELRAPLPGDVLLATVIGEEDGGLGSYALLRRGWRADACVIPEPTSLDIAPATCGALTFEITVRGAATHASRRLDGTSAIEKFLAIFTAMRRLEYERNFTKHPLSERWTLPIPIEIGRVSAGDWTSTVPDLLRADGRIGVALGEDVASTRAALEEAVAAACSGDSWLREHPATVRWWGGQFASAVTDEDAAIVGTVRAAHASVSRRAQQTWATPYGSDLRLLQGLGGIPTIRYGPGDAALAHSPGELVPIDELITATAALALTAMG